MSACLKCVGGLVGGLLVMAVLSMPAKAEDSPGDDREPEIHQIDQGEGNFTVKAIKDDLVVFSYPFASSPANSFVIKISNEKVAEKVSIVLKKPKDEPNLPGGTKLQAYLKVVGKGATEVEIQPISKGDGTQTPVGESTKFRIDSK